MITDIKNVENGKEKNYSHHVDKSVVCCFAAYSFLVFFFNSNSGNSIRARTQSL